MKVPQRSVDRPCHPYRYASTADITAAAKSWGRLHHHIPRARAAHRLTGDVDPLFINAELAAQRIDNLQRQP